MAMAALKNGAGLLAARFCLGIPESGVGQCRINCQVGGDYSPSHSAMLRDVL